MISSKEYFYNNFDNFGFIITEFTEQELAPIKKEIEEYKHKGLDKSWVTIDDELLLEKSKQHIENLIMPFALEYDNLYNYLETKYGLLDKKLPIVLDTTWVNFQKKHEFSPAHNHNGLFSFVIWIDIPYNIKDEKSHTSARFPATLNKDLNLPGHFQFIFPTTLGETTTHTIPVDQTYNNKMIIFPSRIYHTVYPFYTSDNYRITVSGNFKFKT